MVTNPRYANGHRRRELRKRVIASETLCGWEHCEWPDDPIDKTLTYLRGQHGPKCTDPACKGCVPHPMRGEVDEIIPVSMGGNPLARSNVRLLHRICNQRRGNGTRTPRTVAPADAFPTSTEW